MMKMIIHFRVIVVRQADNGKALRWVPHANLYTSNQAQLFYEEQHMGLSEVIHGILQVFCCVLELQKRAIGHTRSTWSFTTRFHLQKLL